MKIGLWARTEAVDSIFT